MCKGALQNNNCHQRGIGAEQNIVITGTLRLCTNHFRLMEGGKKSGNLCCDKNQLVGSGKKNYFIL